MPPMDGLYSGYSFSQSLSSPLFPTPSHGSPLDRSLLSLSHIGIGSGPTLAHSNTSTPIIGATGPIGFDAAAYRWLLQILLK